MLSIFKKYKNTCCASIIACNMIFILVYMNRQLFGLLFLVAPFIVYRLEKKGYYKKAEKMMKDCRDDKQFEFTDENHGQNGKK